MSEQGTGRSAADVAAEQVEGILGAAEAAAEEIKQAALREADALRATGRNEAGRELELARKKAIELGADARREAKLLVGDATKEAAQIREQTRRQIEGRVSEAEAAAAQVLHEARTLSSGLRQLGTALQSQGERILRDVQAAHKRMQADLRVAPIDDDLRLSEPRPARRTPEESPRPSARRAERAEQTGATRATPEEREAIERAAARLGVGERRPARRRTPGRDDPVDDFDVPSWVER